MKKVCITGDTRGIGLNFRNHFLKLGYTVVGFNRSTGLDTVVKESEGCDIFINNAYIDGQQIEFLNSLVDKVGKMIICGSVAAFYPDPQLPKYSKHKLELVEKIRKLNNTNILLLHLSAKGYNNPEAILEVVNLWLKFPIITEVMFDHTGEPNG
jgi:NAD(P)-dependent dehydrogenase (short-subunit alcohol dehydrogenase family)